MTQRLNSLSLQFKCHLIPADKKVRVKLDDECSTSTYDEEWTNGYQLKNDDTDRCRRLNEINGRGCDERRSCGRSMDENLESKQRCFPGYGDGDFLSTLTCTERILSSPSHKSFGRITVNGRGKIWEASLNFSELQNSIGSLYKSPRTTDIFSVHAEACS